MKTVIAIEGIDGSGKSSLARHIQALCQTRKVPCTRVGRRSGYVTPLIAKLTRMLGEETRNLTTRAEICLRLAREHQRARLVERAPDGIVVLNRYVITLLSLARLYECDSDFLREELGTLVRGARLDATLFIRCPFEDAWARVTERNPRLSHPKMRTKPLLHKVARFMEEDFERGFLTAAQWRVENTGTLQEAEQQVTALLEPYLAPREAASPAEQVCTT